METQQVSQIIEILRNTYPEVETALDFSNPFELLVATILSAQTTDKQVNLVTPALFARFPDPATMAEATLEEIQELIRTIGLYKNKSRHLKETARLLSEQYGGKVPQSREDLLTLPGVGRKTANVVLSNAFGIPAIAVDTHVFRVARRLGLSQGKTPQEVEEDLMEVIPRKDWNDAHHWLIWHGRLVCKAQRPDCLNCPLPPVCLHFQSLGGTLPPKADSQSRS